MKKIFLIFAFVNVMAAHASIPTVEGLFRNSSNKEVKAEGIVYSYSIVEQENDVLLQKTESETTDGELEGEMLKEKIEPIYVKESLFIPADGKSIRSIKYIYNSSEMNTKSLIKMKFTPDFSAKIINEFDINKRVFNSLGAMYLLNDSAIVGSLLADKGNGFKRIVNS